MRAIKPAGSVPTSRNEFDVNNELKTTFELLAASENESATSVLVAALDLPDVAIQAEAVRTIFRRRNSLAQREVLRRLNEADSHWREIVSEFRGRMAAALRDAVQGLDRLTCDNACQVILEFGEYDLMAALIGVAEDEGHPHRETAAGTLLKLAEQLYGELATPRDHQRQPRDPQLILRNALGSLELSLQRFSLHKRQEVIEAHLLLANRDNALLKQLLKDPHVQCYLVMVDVLTHSPRPGVMRLLLSFLDDPAAPSAALGILAHRHDSTFIRHLLRRVGCEPAAVAAHNLQRIEHFPWLRDNLRLLDELDDASQEALIRMISTSGMRRLDVFPVLAYLLQNGKPGGRCAAASTLRDYNGAEANALILEALDDSDPRVQAHAYAQLRARAIPGAMSRLLDQLDNPNALIRETVRGALGEFNIERFLGAFELLDDNVRQSTGALVRKIDPRTIPLLAEELHARSRTRRLRGIGAAAAVGAINELEESLIALVSDDDHMVRMAACRALAGSQSEAARQVLTEALGDRSQPVREAALAALEETP